MLSSQTKVFFVATLRIVAASVPVWRFASALTSADQSGLTYHVAPTNGLSRCVPCGGGVGVGLAVKVRVGVGDGPVVGTEVGVLVRVGVFDGPGDGVIDGVRVGGMLPGV